MGQNRFIEQVSSQKIGQEYELRVEKHELANGKIFNYHIFNLPHFAIIIPKKDKKYILIKQYRPSWRTIAYEFPAGVADSFSEDPVRTASRELEEETGYLAGRMDFIGKFRHTSRSTQFCHSYVADDLKYIGQKLDEGEYIEEILEVSSEQIEDFITNEEMVDISHIASWYRYQQLIKRGLI
jgi:ADP-ribose pyrophosphatase